MKQGMKQGMEQGMKQGLEKGRAEGMAEERMAMARNLKKLGVPLETIQEASGLSAEELASL